MNKTITISAVLLVLLSFFCTTVYAASIDLSEKEREWIGKNRKILISGPQAFPPFQYVSENGELVGMASDYVRLIAEMVGLETEAVKNVPWPEILRKTENGEIDLLTCSAKTPEREKFLVFLPPHLSFPLVIISRKDAPFMGGILDLNSKTVAIIKKNVAYDWLKRDGVDFTPYYVDTPLDALKAISTGNADASIENLAVATHLIEKNGLANLKVAAPTSYGNYDLSMAVRKDLPELAAIFKKGLAAISQEKNNEIRQKWIAVRYEHGIDAKDIIKWVSVACLVCLMPLIIFYIWNRRLKKEIMKRREAEAEKELLIVNLQNALDEIKTLKGILPLCTFCKKIRDEQGAWQNVDSYIHSHSQADISHSICPDCLKINYPEEYVELFPR